MEQPKREDYPNDVRFQIAYMKWRRIQAQIAARQAEEEK